MITEGPDSDVPDSDGPDFDGPDSNGPDSDVPDFDGPDSDGLPKGSNQVKNLTCSVSFQDQMFLNRFKMKVMLAMFTNTFRSLLT